MLSVPVLFIVKFPPDKPLLEDFDDHTGLKRFSVLPFFTLFQYNMYLVPRDSYLKIKLELRNKSRPFFSLVRLRYLVPFLTMLFLIALRVRVFLKLFLGALVNKKELLRSEICRIGKQHLNVFFHRFSADDSYNFVVGERDILHEVISVKNFTSDGKVCVFAHYDVNQNLHDYVVDYLDSLTKNGYEIVFVTSSARDELFEQIRPYISKMIGRENVGHDFLSFAVGLSFFRRELQGREILIANDSVFVDSKKLSKLMDDLKSRNCAVYGASKSIQFTEHLQSYFMSFDKSLTSQEVFWQFWKEYPTTLVKDFIVWHGEIGLSRYLRDNGFSLDAFTDVLNFSVGQNQNPVYDRGVELVENYEFPFLKKQMVLRFYGKKNSRLRRFLDKDKNSESLEKNILSYFKMSGMPL